MILHGREAELERLSRILSAVRDTGHVVLVTGEPGIGKTTLLNELIRRGEGMGLSVASGKANELDQMAPLASLMTCLPYGEHVHHLSTDRDHRIWLVEELARVIEARGPVMVALDDAQWADPLSRFALTHLPVRLRTSPVLWLLTGRNGTLEEFARLADRVEVDQIALGPLPSEAMDRLAHETLGHPPDAHVRELIESAGGNPFLAKELLGEQRGLRGRLSALPTSTLRLLQAGAVLGPDFTLAAAAALLDTPQMGLLTDLEEAVGSGLVTDHGMNLAFRHDLIRQAVYAGILPSVRNALHRTAATHLVAMGRGAVQAAAHLQLGALPGDEEAISLLLRAARDALPVMPATSAALAVHALSLAEVASPLRYEAGEQAIACLTAAGRNQMAVEVGDSLLRSRPPLATFGRVQAALGRPLWDLGLVAELRRRVEAALGACDSGTHARLVALRALALSCEAELGPAREALAGSIETRDRDAHVTSLLALGETELNAGDVRAALAHFTALGALEPDYTAEKILTYQYMDDFAASEKLLTLAQNSESSRQAALSWAQAGHHLGLGNLNQAEESLLSLVRLAQSHQVDARVTLAWIACLRGKPDLAATHLTPEADPAITFMEAMIADLRGDHTRGVEILKGLDAPVSRQPLLRTTLPRAVRLAMRGGAPALASDLASQAEELAGRNPGVPSTQAIAAHCAGLAHNDLERLAEAHTLATKSPRPLVRAAIARDLGWALLARGESRRAAPHLKRAREVFTELGAYGEAASTMPVQDRQQPVQGWEALTATERKVAGLIAAGHSNQSAAEHLVVSPHTINTHLGSIFRKLDVKTRVQLTLVVLSRSE
ncbi:helix-turn-helix transcriptional regulator [Nonomuraea sp. SYSU D8015]|uniref:helix-turn-helix transcriptional regulator n=1 Tax=Nonomuraea sp. SYSU D8015 TaxID=2593644 RepID=UPI001660BCC5|nr:LuxR family transcriptional regulator [Nonomuraea sp. SYSU D8015]